ncbi:hypothetical protein GTP44_15120 [Duganella sp. FT50W]|uniref:Uncharacterized protein n=1 Tax=Duganella lactea TaxID=2692173 RepID=A0A6L8MKU5_9BURK|nr:hypothetical protein [Duganella lactea]
MNGGCIAGYFQLQDEIADARLALPGVVQGSAHVGSLYSLNKMKERGEPDEDGSNVQPPRKAAMPAAALVAYRRRCLRQEQFSV